MGQVSFITAWQAWLIILVVIMVGGAHPPETSAAVQYRISWYTIDGGGGTSTGGAYTLTGTIGQSDADWCSGGKYELLGGFWPGGPLCIVAFDDFARFADQWLKAGTGLAGDLDEDNDVDFDDLTEFADYWLAYCPADWQLK